MMLVLPVLLGLIWREGQKDEPRQLMPRAWVWAGLRRESRERRRRENIVWIEIWSTSVYSEVRGSVTARQVRRDMIPGGQRAAGNLGRSVMLFIWNS